MIRAAACVTALTSSGQDLATAWTSVGDSIMDEIKRIRGLTDAGGGNSFAALLGQFNAETAAARGGDQDAAKALPDLSKALLDQAATTATSRQELARIEAQTAASLEATYAMIASATSASNTATASVLPASVGSTSNGSTGLEAQSWWSTFAANSAASPTTSANDGVAAAIGSLRQEVSSMHQDLNSGLATIAGNTGKVARVMDGVTRESGGNAISVKEAA